MIFDVIGTDGSFLFMAEYTVSYVNPSSGNSTIEVASASDAKAIVESKGNSRSPYLTVTLKKPINNRAVVKLVSCTYR